MDFKKELENIRIERGLLQKEFADLIGISAPCYSAIVNGKMRVGVKVARRISAITGISVADIIRGN